MTANRANERGFLTHHEVTAFAALPHDFFTLFENALHLNIAEQLQIPLFVGLFNSGHGTETRGKFRETFLVSRLGKAVVHVGPLVVLAACSRLEVFFGCPDAAQGLKPNRCVFFFIGSGFFKNRRNLLIAFFSGNAGKVRVLVARLRLSGKSRLQILLSLCSLQ